MKKRGRNYLHVGSNGLWSQVCIGGGDTSRPAGETAKSVAITDYIF